MVRRLIAWARAPEPRVPYAVARAEWERETAVAERRQREWRSAPVWLRWAPILLYALPVLVFLGLIHDEWWSALLLAGAGVGLITWPLELLWRRHTGKRRPSAPTPP